MDKEVELLSRVAANHLFLGQFEALRASLRSLRSRNPELALDILMTIVSEGGRFDGVLWSEVCPSASHLAWLSVIELPDFENLIRRLDVEILRLKVEFMLLVQEVYSKVLDGREADSEKEEIELGESSDAANCLLLILDFGLRRLKNNADHCNNDDGTLKQVSSMSMQEALNGLKDVFLKHADIFDVLCWNIHRQLRYLEPSGSKLAITVNDDKQGNASLTAEESDLMVQLQISVQMAHLTALKEYSDAGDLSRAISCVRYLHLDFGLDESEYQMALQGLIKNICVRNNGFGEPWHFSRKAMLKVYAEALSSNHVQFAQMIQSIHDENFSDEIEQNMVSGGTITPLPLQKYLEARNLGQTAVLDGQPSQNSLRKSCMRELYHFARVSGSHVLECVMDFALSAVKREQLQEASDTLSLFPLLQPLVAVMGWDLLSSKTLVRRKLMKILWTSKSQELRLEEHSVYGKQSDEISCVEYLCDLLCFHLDLASFVACVNSGRQWNSKDSMLLSRNEEMSDQSTSSSLDPFVENFVLERLSIQTPLRVLFDLVPGIKFQEAIEIISMQPIVTTTAAWKRLQDIELVHLRYALESAILALGAMGGCISEENERLYSHALRYLKDMQNHMEAINNIPRKVFLLGIIVSLLYMDQVPIASAHFASSSISATVGQHDDDYSSSSDNNTVISFLELLVDILHHSLLDVGSEVDNFSKSDSVINVKQAVEWRISNIKHFVEDWKWRLSVLQRLLPVSPRPWGWTEALALLRAAPSHLLNLCMQRAKYDIGEEAVHRFSLSAEDKAVLELTEWVAGVSSKASVEDSVSRMADEVTNTVLDLDFSLLRTQLGPLVAILLCIDVAATSARSIDVCMLLLNQARNILSDIYPGGSPRLGSAYWDQIKDVTMISVIRRVLQRLLDLLEEEKALTLKEIFAGYVFISPAKQPSKQGQSRALAILHQIIDDAHQGKRQFLSGKLHNLARVAAEEDTDDSSLKRNGNHKTSPGGEKNAVIGLGLKPQRSTRVISASTEKGVQYINHDVKEPGRRLLSHFTFKPTYLSAFIIYIATIGDIVDGIDTTHDFNFFSLVYEWPKDLLTRLVFERGSIDAAGKVADIMCADLVHEVISACVPPVFPPRSGHGWASIPLLSSYSRTSDNKISLHPFNVFGSGSNIPVATPEAPFYPLKLDIVKHLAKLSPVRAILACVFGSTILSSNTGSSISSSVSAESDQESDTERLFYEFALDQSERFPTLNRWIQMQSNLHRVSESAIAASRNADTHPVQCLSKISVKRSRDSESDTESDIDDIILGTQVHATSEPMQRSPVSRNLNLDSTAFLSLDWENEEPYEKSVERLICEGKLMDALALSDRFLRGGASDILLRLLIEHGEENSLISGQPPGYGSHSYSSNSWQYCLRLKDKHLASKLALKYLQRWELNAAIDVLTMCSCHLPPSDPLRNEVLQRRKDLQKYNYILSAEDKHKSWQEVECECKEDPEGLALRLAGKGAVSAALKVAESADLSIDLRRELQGRQLVKLLTTDPLNGGGPAEASRFLSSLHDPDDVLPVAIGAMKLLSDLRSKQLLVHFFLKRKAGNLSDIEVARLNSWALGLRVLAVLPLPWQQRCSALHEHPHLILEVLLMMKQLQYASLILKEFPSLRDDSLIFMYSKKAIAISPSFTPREPRISVSVSRTRQQSKAGLLSRTNFTNSLSNLQKEARRAFSWAPRDIGSKVTTSETQRKRKSSGFTPSEAMSGIHEEQGYIYSIEGQERSPTLSVTEWVLVGDPIKDNTVRSSHRYETSPDIVLFKGLLSLCSDDLVSVKGALDQSVTQMKSVLSSQQLPLSASTEAIGHAYHATEIFVQALAFAKTELRKLLGNSDLPISSERSRDMDDASAETSSSSVSSQYPDELSELQAEADIWFGRAELLQSLLGSGIVASLDDIADKESSTRLRDRLIKDEQYSMAVYTCKKCKIDAFSVWNYWGHALIRMEHYAQARIKFKQALQLHKDNPSSVIKDIINTLEGGPPVDIRVVLSMYEHLAKSASTILDDSLSADSYLIVLNMPSTFPRSEKSRRYHDSANNRSASSGSVFEDGPHSNLDNVRYLECIYYLQEYDCPRMLGFMFKHGHYADACALFFPLNTTPSAFQLSAPGTLSTASSPQRLDSLTTDYGSIEDLCDLCIGYGAMDVLEDILATRKASVAEDASLSQHIAVALARICIFCETHRHFNYLYRFLVIKQDHVAAGLCCIQLFMNSSSQEEAVKHLEHAKMHFEEGLSAKEGEATKLLSKPVRGKLASGKLSEEGLIKFAACVAIQVNVLKNFNDTEGLPWKHSLFGNPSDPETFRRRCEIAEKLEEKNFDLAFQVIYQFNLPAVDIYAAVAASLAERKKSGQLTEFFKNVKGTVGADDWDQVLGAAINVYANRHKERPDRLIDMLISSHRKVLACVVCGRLKSAFQIASRSGSVADVQYVAHQALHANALPVLDMCKQWLSQYM